LKIKDLINLFTFREVQITIGSHCKTEKDVFLRFEIRLLSKMESYISIPKKSKLETDQFCFIF